MASVLGALKHGPAAAGGAAATAGTESSVLAAGSIGWGWTVPVAALALVMTVGGVLLDQLLRRRMELSVRLRDAEFA